MRSPTRGLVVLPMRTLCVPSVLPRRTNESVFCENMSITAETDGGETVLCPVPAAAVVRDYNYPINRATAPGMCTGCAFGSPICAHAWPVLDPRSIIVLGARGHEGGRMRFGWYVRIEPTAPTSAALTRVPQAVAEDLVSRMMVDVELRTCGGCGLDPSP